MSSGIETVDLIGPWIYRTLAADPVLRAVVGDRISDTLAPGTLTPPYLTYNLASNVTRAAAAAGPRLWVETIYDVRIISRTASWTGPIADGARRIDELLGGPDGVGVFADVPGGRIESQRDRLIQQAELTQALQYRHLGGRYRILAYAISE